MLRHIQEKLRGLIAFRSMQENHDQKIVGKVKLFTWTEPVGPSARLYCTRCAVSYCLWHLLSVKNIWFQYPLSEEQKEWDSELGVDRGQGVEFGLPIRNFYQFRFFFSFFGRAYVMFLSSPQTSASQKAFFIPVFTEKPHQCIAVKWVVISAGPDREALLLSAHEQHSSPRSLPL